MELRIEELMAAKGLKWKDLGDRTGLDPSNIKSSLKSNPTLKRLTEVADAIGVEVPDLFREAKTKEQKPLGMISINGETYNIVTPSISAVKVPVYTNYKELREKLRGFISGSIKQGKNASICGYLETFELFSLVYDSESERFLLSLCYVGGMLTYGYDKYEFNKVNNKEDKVSWDVPQVYQEIINDVECAVLGKLGVEREESSE